MSETTDLPPSSGITVDDDDWLTAAPAEAITTADEKEPTSSRRLLAIRAGLIAAGAVVGGVVVASVGHGSSSTTANGIPSSAVGQFPGNGQLPANGQLPTNGQVPNFGGSSGTGPLTGGPGGGLSGEQRLSGTLVSVGSSTVTVKTSSGTATYDVTSSSEIVRNDQVVSLSALRPGDQVFVHVYPAGSGSQLAVERLFATSATTGGTTGGTKT